MKKVYLLYGLLSILGGLTLVVFALGLICPEVYVRQASCYYSGSPQSVFAVLVKPHRHTDTLWIEPLGVAPNGYPTWKEYSRHGNSQVLGIVEAKPYHCVKMRLLSHPFQFQEDWVYTISPAQKGCWVSVKQTLVLHSVINRGLLKIMGVVMSPQEELAETLSILK